MRERDDVSETARLTDIDLREALRYALWRGPDVPPDVMENARSCAGEILRAARPAAVWRLFELEPDGTLRGAAFFPQGEDIRRHLAGCGRVVLLAVTLGAGVDALLRRAQVRDMARAVLLDACASAAIENVADNLCADVAQRLAPSRLTARFSPGYGDMPLAQQAELLKTLDAARRIGVTLTDGGMMLPQKSVTALAGVADAAGTGEPSGGGCAHCALRGDCLYRKDGKRCEHG